MEVTHLYRNSCFLAFRYISAFSPRTNVQRIFFRSFGDRNTSTPSLLEKNETSATKTRGCHSMEWCFGSVASNCFRTHGMPRSYFSASCERDCLSHTYSFQRTECLLFGCFTLWKRLPQKRHSYLWILLRFPSFLVSQEPHSGHFFCESYSIR